jgi:hypothetical protein
LVFWSLSDDLLTNGFNIVSGHNPAVNPNHPQMTIGTGATNTLTSYLTFYETTATCPPGENPNAPIEWAGDVKLWGNTVDIEAVSIDLGYHQTIKIRDNTGWPPQWEHISYTDDETVLLNGYFRVTNTSTFDLPIIGYQGGAVAFGPGGIRFNDGTIQTSAVATFTSTQIATSSTLGVIRVGEYLSITTNTGILSVNTASLTALVYTLPIATTSTLGGVIITNTSTIVINTQSGVLTIPIATTSTLGVVSVGTTLSINTTTGALNVGAASSSTRGGIRVGYGLEIVDGDTLNLNTSTAFSFLPAATTSTRGGIRVGGDFTITSGDILNLGIVHLQYPFYAEDQYITASNPYIPTNESTLWLTKGQFGKTIYQPGYVYSDTSINGVNLYNTNGITVAQIGDAEGTGYASALHVGENTVSLRLERSLYGVIENPPPPGYRWLGDDPLEHAITKDYVTVNPGIIILGSDAVQMGYDQYYSTLRVSNIYNFAGTGAPFFPAGVQYQDNTIQRTAWRGYDQGLI